MTLPVHLAVHYIGCGAAIEGGIAVPSRVGSFIDCLAQLVGRVSVVAFDPPTEPAFEDRVDFEVRAANVSFVSLGAKGTWRDYRERRVRVAEIIRSSSADWDVLLFHFLPNRRARLVYGPNRCEKIAAFVVGTTAVGDVPVESSWLRRMVLRLNRAWTEYQQRAVLQRSAVAIVNSDELRASIPRSMENVRVIPLAARRRSNHHRQADRFDGEHVNVLLSGRITFEKGVMDAIEAFARVRTDDARYRLHIAGEGPASDALMERATELGVRDDVVCHGWIPAGDDLFALLKQMDVLLMPSYAAYEGFPQVIWEAMAHSVLVVSTPVRGPRDRLEDGREALFVPMHDPAALAAAVRRLAHDAELRRRLLEHAYALAEPVNVDETARRAVDAIAETWPSLAAPGRR